MTSVCFCFCPMFIYRTIQINDTALTKSLSDLSHTEKHTINCVFIRCREVLCEKNQIEYTNCMRCETILQELSDIHFDTETEKILCANCCDIIALMDK